MTNQFTFTVTNPADRLSKPFDSTWIQGSNADEAKEILSRTYQPKYGFILILKHDWFAIRAAKQNQIGVDLSLASANL